MKAEYRNEYGEYESCELLGHNLSGSMCLIVLDGERGWCSCNLVEECDTQ
jgi:hypothetical protein